MKAFLGELQELSKQEKASKQGWLEEVAKESKGQHEKIVKHRPDIRKVK